MHCVVYYKSVDLLVGRFVSWCVHTVVSLVCTAQKCQCHLDISQKTFRVASCPLARLWHEGNDVDAAVAADVALAADVAVTFKMMMT